VIFDGRNLYDPAQMKAQGWRYYAIGRGVRHRNAAHEDVHAAVRRAVAVA
jgi:hypothetical protein